MFPVALIECRFDFFEALDYKHEVFFVVPGLIDILFHFLKAGREELRGEIIFSLRFVAVRRCEVLLDGCVTLAHRFCFGLLHVRDLGECC